MIGGGNIKKLLFLIFIVAILFLAGCNQDKYSNDESAAIVNNKEITVGEIKSLHSIEDGNLKLIVRNYVKEEIMVQEAMKRQIDISDKVDEALEGYIFPAEPPKGKENPILNFYKKQADKLDMSPEDYAEFYIEKTTKRREYTKKYIENELGTPNQLDDAEYQNKLNELYDNLLIKYKDNVEIYIK
ncbi:hypothetical protein [Aquibacillus sediminis]|uniref:hypothetical protein n=1 Tax=Aquibacillus sediminis TaxID=2574734 RepID=UPI001108C59A|nr:hypothetical protein [Aquibacillus sediminis]